MIKDDVLKLIDTYGADTSRWPEAKRPLLLEVANDPDIASRLQEAQQLDRLLGSYAANVNPEAVSARVMKKLHAPSPIVLHRHFRQYAMAACLMLALVAGYGFYAEKQPLQQPHTIASIDDEDVIELMAIDAGVDTL